MRANAIKSKQNKLLSKNCIIVFQFFLLVKFKKKIGENVGKGRKFVPEKMQKKMYDKNVEARAGEGNNAEKSRYHAENAGRWKYLKDAEKSSTHKFWNLKAWSPLNPSGLSFSPQKTSFSKDLERIRDHSS